jgi:hypothetical protein
MVVGSIATGLPPSTEAQWDDGTTERYGFREEGGTLRASSTSVQISTFLQKLAERRTVRISAMNALNEKVTVRISLKGPEPLRTY